MWLWVQAFWNFRESSRENVYFLIYLMFNEIFKQSMLNIYLINFYSILEDKCHIDTIVIFQTPQIPLPCLSPAASVTVFISVSLSGKNFSLSNFIQVCFMGI